MRDFWWAGAFDLEAAVERFTRNPDAAEFCPTFRAGESFGFRSPDSMEIDSRFRNARKLEEIEAAFKLRPGDLTALNAGLPRGEVLEQDVPVRLPDPGFATWIAARLAGRAVADPTLPAARRVAILRSLVPLAAANPTALDTVLSRLVLAEQPASAAVLDRITALAGAAIAKPGAMAAALPDSALPA
jgi:hypothetical protein